jgi:hypothetical protein
MMPALGQLIPLGQAALLHRLTREQLLRRIQIGEVRGEFRAGRWYCAPPAREDAAQPQRNHAANA